MKTTESKPQKNRVFDLVDKAPFAGKFSVKDSYIGYSTAPDEKKVKKAITSTAFLGFMVAAHAYQAKAGFDSLSVHAPAAIDNPNTKDIIFSGIDGAYALAMSAVALRQADLMRKVGQKHAHWMRNHKKVPESERQTEKRPYSHKKAAMALAFGVTLSGQVAESVSMVDALVQDLQDKREHFQPAPPVNPNNSYFDPDTNTMYFTPSETSIGGKSPDPDDYIAPDDLDQNEPD